MALVVVLLAVGVLAGRLRSLPDGTARALDWVVIHLSLPGLVLARLPAAGLDAATAVVPVAVSWGGLAVLAGAVLAVARAAGWSRHRTGCLLLCVTTGNTSFLGIPATEALLGPDHVPFAVLYDQLGSFLAVATWGTVVAARYGSGASPTAAGTLRRVLTFPPFVSLLVAGVVVVTDTTLPVAVAAVVDALAVTLTPLSMLAVGMRLRVPRRDAVAPLAVGLGLRMVAAPAVVVPLALAAGGGLAWETSAFESAMPPMVTAGIISSAAGLDERLAAALVGGGVLVSLVTLPVVAALVT